MAEAGWDTAIGRRLGLSGAVPFTAKVGGRPVLHLVCTTDGQTHDFPVARRFPTEVMLKKLSEAGWDTTRGKVRCPVCVSNRIKARAVPTVAVAPVEEHEPEFELDVRDLRIDTFRASGPGGQHVNTTDSAVRITHVPSGLTAQSQSNRSQHRNKSEALQKLQARVAVWLTQQGEHEVEEEDEMKKKDNVARLGINDTNVAFVVPKASPLFSMFSDDAGHGKAYWSFEMRAKPSPGSEPYFAVVKQKTPEPGTRHPGIAKGSFVKVNGSYNITILAKLLPVVTKHGPFRTAELKLVEQRDDLLLFELPKIRQNVILRGSKRKEVEATPPPPPPPLPVVEPVTTEPPTPAAAAEPAVPQPKQRVTPVVIQAPPRELSVEMCVNFLNRTRRDKGDNFRMSMGEGGELRYILRGGAW